MHSGIVLRPTLGQDSSVQEITSVQNGTGRDGVIYIGQDSTVQEKTSVQNGTGQEWMR